VGALHLQLGEQTRRARRVVPERLDVEAEPTQHDVEIACRAEMPAEPAELFPERPGPLRVEERPRSAKERAQPTGGHTELMQILRLVAAPRAGIVHEERPVVGREGDAECLTRPSAFHDWTRRIRGREIQRAVELRSQWSASRRAGLAEVLFEPPKRLLVAVHELDLDLPEAARDPLALEHGDVVVHDLGTGCADSFAARSQPSDRHEVAAAQVRLEEHDQLCGRSGRQAGHFELEPRRAAR